jgi:hypothetical protein
VELFNLMIDDFLNGITRAKPDFGLFETVIAHAPAGVQMAQH